MEEKPEMREPFQSITEVEAYLDQPALPCLMCGNPYQSLRPHIARIHNLTAGEYRTLFGIPAKYVLAGNLSPRRKHEVKAPQDKPADQPAVSPYAKTKGRWGRKREGKSGWRAEDYEEYLNRIAKGRSIEEISKDKDLMSPGYFRRWCRTHPDFAKRFAAIVDTQPFALQAKGRYAGDSLNGLVVFLHEVHKIGFDEIGATLQTSPRLIAALYKRLVASGRIEAYRRAD